uniref:EGF-like domain-containing protein n=1 Tax=Grammatophora oceanica TaxID=210454 RepID=A0A7S1YGG3_9STRA|mmetsp:Transcript_45189/g.67110  ORF Transcript_45189/g.67110 Transcript_45189/m.67110 type:complete len:204 (+) Transcript_45189:100-711(+)|eukprot:CAMPEP_0194030774 /NCGR_PEP_ID=MMETSP0009_2-20130614/4125_1 /TAXON_ID=210454 /ORGANISM="Grammatophora oceanica, Strain CCMP 410" /LENGTH=203 /DNA_ID=CAMNT_0038670773 /DNA_START=91 /DNA_END=702 /DNA_ORIENTATION=+
MKIILAALFLASSCAVSFATATNVQDETPTQFLRATQPDAETDSEEVSDEGWARRLYQYRFVVYDATYDPDTWTFSTWFKFLGFRDEIIETPDRSESTSGPNFGVSYNPDSDARCDGSYGSCTKTEDCLEWKNARLHDGCCLFSSKKDLCTCGSSNQNGYGLKPECVPLTTDQREHPDFIDKDLQEVPVFGASAEDQVASPDP